MNGCSPKMSQSERDYQAEDDHRTLTRANEIQSDKDRMRGVTKHHAKSKKALSGIDRMLSGRRR